MERIHQPNDLILLLDNYLLESQSLHQSFEKAGYDCPVVVVNDDGFLPENAISAYGFFLGDFKDAPGVLGRPRYFNEIKVPDYWEISGNNKNGTVSDLYRERGKIFYTEPLHKRQVKVVDWKDERGIVRSSDHYNRYGAIYARTVFNAKGQRVNKSYFSAAGREIIVENYVTGDIILNDGGEVKFFRTKTDFVLYLFTKAGFWQSRIFYNSLSTPFLVSQRLSALSKRDVLFWQERSREDIPGNMQIIFRGQAARTEKVIVQNRRAYDKLAALGANKDMMQKLGFIYSFEKENHGRPEALICTNSDRIEQCEKIVSKLPGMRFSIAALTEMSPKLLGMERYDNVSLYPNVKTELLDRLFLSCDYYFDINHAGEIVSAVRRAFLHNHLIFAFQETAHNIDYAADRHIYAAADADAMIADVKAAMENESLRKEHLRRQHEAALAEEAEAYLHF